MSREFWYTHSGHRVEYFNVYQTTIDLSDIAIALSRIPRFLGHSEQPYSVAEHCVLGTRAILTHVDADEDIRVLAAKAFLLHDAHEAYVGDAHGIMLRTIDMGGFKSLTKTFQTHIHDAFGILPIKASGVAAIVRDFDDFMLKYELARIMTRCDLTLSPKNPLSDDQIPIQLWDHKTAAQEFLDMAQLLDLKAAPKSPARRGNVEATSGPLT